MFGCLVRSSLSLCLAHMRERVSYTDGAHHARAVWLPSLSGRGAHCLLYRVTQPTGRAACVSHLPALLPVQPSPRVARESVRMHAGR